MPESSSNQKDREYLVLGLKIAGDFGAAIAVPILVFVLLGQWLDQRYGYGYRFTIVAFGISAPISAFWMYKKAKLYGKLYETLNKSK